MVFGSILNRMIFWELVKVFLLSLGSLTGMFLMAVVIQEGSRLGLGMWQLLGIIPLFIPNLLPYTIPATTLFASCVVYGRLAHDNEVIAIKSAGVRLYRIIAPAVLLGCITTAITAGLYHTVIPRSQQLLQQSVLKDPEEVLYNLLKRERIRRRTYKTRAEARQDVFDYIEMFYNPKRKHVRNGMLSPVDFERQHAMIAEGV